MFFLINFHNELIQHLFIGQYKDGWCLERENYLNNINI